MIRRILHWLAHRFGVNGGMVESGWDAHGRVWVWFRCDGCGKQLGKHPILWT